MGASRVPRNTEQGAKQGPSSQFAERAGSGTKAVLQQQGAPTNPPLNTSQVRNCSPGFMEQAPSRGLKAMYMKPRDKLAPLQPGSISPQGPFKNHGFPQGKRASQVKNHSPGNMEQASSRGHEASPQSGLGVGCELYSSSKKPRGRRALASFFGH